jgi:hypothetical protein
MSNLSIWHWIIVLIFSAVFVVPCWRIVRRAGYSGAWSLVTMVPLLNIVMLWVFAYVRWPNED